MYQMSFQSHEWPTLFLKVYKKILADAHLHSNAGYYIDDFGSGGSCYSSADDHLNSLTTACIRSKIKVSADKLELSYLEMLFFGFLIK